MLRAIPSQLAMRLRLPEKRHLPASVVLATMFLLYLIAGLSLNAVGGRDDRVFANPVPWSWNDLGSAGPREAPPVPEPLAFRDMTPQQALAFNAAVPVSTKSNPAARPFVFKAASEIDRLRSLDCLTAAVYYEAAVESTDGQRAVAQVVLNRLRHPAFPKTVCGVVFQGSERSTGCQFTFTCDGAMARIPSEAGWQRAHQVAEEALAGAVYKPVGYATHYHTNWVVPYWSSSLTKLANVGAHIFYRWEGGWGRPAAFRYGNAGVEPELALMRHLSSVPGVVQEDMLLAADADLAGPSDRAANPATPADFVGRGVVRHYEPLREQAAASARAELAKPGVPSSIRWALTGDTGPVERAKPAPKQVPVLVTPPPLFKTTDRAAGIVAKIAAP